VAPGLRTPAWPTDPPAPGSAPGRRAGIGLEIPSRLGHVRICCSRTRGAINGEVRPGANSRSATKRATPRASVRMLAARATRLRRRHRRPVGSSKTKGVLSRRTRAAESRGPPRACAGASPYSSGIPAALAYPVVSRAATGTNTPMWAKELERAVVSCAAQLHSSTQLSHCETGRKYSQLLHRQPMRGWIPRRPKASSGRFGSVTSCQEG